MAAHAKNGHHQKHFHNQTKTENRHHHHQSSSNNQSSNHSMKKDHVRGSHKSISSSGMGSVSSTSTKAGPTGYRPGRLTPLEILERVFPLQRRSVLELVLQGCNGDLVKAIEHFISAQDTVAAQHQAALQANSNAVSATQRHHHPHQPQKHQQKPQQLQTPHDISAPPSGSMPRPNPFISSLAAAAASSHAMFGHHHLNAATVASANNTSSSGNSLGAGSVITGPDKLGFPHDLRPGPGHNSSHHHSFHAHPHHLPQQHTPPAAHTGGAVNNKLSNYNNSLKSAFTPLSAAAGAAAHGLHAAFTSHLPSFHPAEAALRNPFFAPSGPGSTDLQLPSNPHLAYAGLGMGLGVSAFSGSSYPSLFGSPFSFHPYRLNFRTSVSPRVRTPDKNSDKSALTDSDHISDSWDETGSPRDGKTVD
ncbi:doublesex- and mab-3-related transcription factor 3 [Elysia marginata]|uniref:Doublesex- and mab-3-related transcription factor 3 n=1 Tax=Elysia marginata TaxID=1093978 RepID=A0AAV4JI51_9GAST|nr:doublesex- and mab-3-related transcription factor 3 [Elysia marginata]